MTDLLRCWSASRRAVSLGSALSPRTVTDRDQIDLPYVALTAVLLVVWMLALTWFGSRDPKSSATAQLEYKRIMQATFAVFGAVAIASYLFKLELPRSYLLVMMPAGLAALLGSRFGWRRWLHRQRDAGALHVHRCWPSATSTP